MHGTDQPQMPQQRPLNETEAKVNLAFGILQAIAFNADEPETVAMRAACAETITSFIKTGSAYDAAWQNAKATA